MFKKVQIFLFIFSLLLGISFFLTSCMKEKETRLRIKANDNSTEALALKEIVKEEVLILLSKTKKEDISLLVDYLNKQLKNKFNNINVSYTKESYPAKSFDNKLIPSGTYPTILITIGEGLGRNWWSVLYPEFFNVSYEASDEIEYRSYIIDKYKEWS